MKTNLTFTLLIVGLLSGFTAHAGGKTQMILDCYEDGNPQAVFSLQLPKNLQTQNSGNTNAQLASGQKLSGGFESHVITDMSRLSGMTSVEAEVNYSLPDYSKPHTLQISFVGQNNPQIHYFGNAELLDLTGHLIKEYLVECKLGQ